MRVLRVRPAAAGVLLSFTLFTLALAGCHKDDPYHPGHHREAPRVTGIEIHEHDNITPHLEVEVHLYDAYDGRLIGCSGNDQGMARVDHSDTFYKTNAYFVRTGYHHDRLTESDVRGRDLFVRVYEDDHSACPSPPGNVDDFIGQSPVFPAEDLYDGGIAMSFDDVAILELAMRY